MDMLTVIGPCTASEGRETAVESQWLLLMFLSNSIFTATVGHNCLLTFKLHHVLVLHTFSSEYAVVRAQHTRGQIYKKYMNNIEKKIDSQTNGLTW